MNLPAPPWMQWHPGDKVVVRYHESDGVHDALGILIDNAAEYVVIRAKRGIVKVEATQMITGKLIARAAAAPTNPPPKLNELDGAS